MYLRDSRRGPSITCLPIAFARGAEVRCARAELLNLDAIWSIASLRTISNVVMLVGLRCSPTMVIGFIEAILQPIAILMIQ